MARPVAHVFVRMEFPGLPRHRDQISYHNRLSWSMIASRAIHVLAPRKMREPKTIALWSLPLPQHRQGGMGAQRHAPEPTRFED